VTLPPISETLSSSLDVQVDILEGGGAHDSYGVLVIQSPTNGSSSTNCDTTAAATDHGPRVTTATLRQVSARPVQASNDDRRWMGRAYRKQLSTWDSIRSKPPAASLHEHCTAC